MRYKVTLVLALARDLHNFNVEVYVGNALRVFFGIEGDGDKGNSALFVGKVVAVEADGVHLDARVVVFLALEEGNAVGMILVLFEIGLLGRIVCNGAFAVGHAKNLIHALAVDNAVVYSVGHIYRELGVVVGDNALGIDHAVIGDLHPPCNGELVGVGLKVLRDSRENVGICPHGQPICSRSLFGIRSKRRDVQRGNHGNQHKNGQNYADRFCELSHKNPPF